MQIAHDVFDARKVSVLSTGELLARVLLQGKFDHAHEHQYEGVLSEVLSRESAAFGVDAGKGQVTRLRLSTGQKTGAEVATKPGPKPKAPEQGSFALTNPKKSMAARTVPAPNQNGAVLAKGRFAGVIRNALGLQTLTSEQQASIFAAAKSKGIKMTEATPDQLKAAAKAAGIKA